MGKKILLCFTIIIIFLMSACNLNSGYYKQMKESKDYVLPIMEEEKIAKQVQENIFNFKHVYSEDKYKVEKLKIEGVERPSGILCREQDILITDSKNDKLVVVDFDGNVIKEVGQTGNGPLEFMSPGDMVRYKNRIYIIDEKNYRVQVLDENLNFVEEIKTRHADSNDPEFVYQHIAVSKNGVYLNGFSFVNDQIDLYTAGATEPIKIGKNFNGPLFNYEEQIYAMNTWNRTYSRKDDSMAYRNGGENHLLLVNDKKREIELECNIMPATDPTSFIINEKEMIALSVSNSSLFTFGKEGDYKFTNVIMDGFEKEDILKFSVNSVGNYYIAATESGMIYRCSLE